MLLPLEIPPGVYRIGTDMQSSGRWRDANLVRWQDGALQPINGWRPLADESLAAAPRGAHAWVTKTGTPWAAFGTYDGLYVIAQNGTQTNITPTGLTAGREDSTALTGYGAGFYGIGTYGTPRASSSTLPVTVWSLDNWGENLVACSPDDGVLYEWALNTSNEAAQISNSPTSCTGLIVTAERFLFALGADGNDRLIKWSDREDNTTWAPVSTNEAGSSELVTSGKILAAKRVPNGTLILTTTDAHLAVYQGQPFVYGFEKVGDGCGLQAAAAAAVLAGDAYWMGQEGFYAYRGGVVEPLQCDVLDYVFRDRNRDQMSKAWAVTNERYQEVWWFYPSASSTEIDRYVVYDARQQVWTIGNLVRTAGVDSGARPFPVWWGSDGASYEHEFPSYNWDSATVYAESGPVSNGVGEETFTALELIPDELTQGDCEVTFKARFHPNDTETTHGPYVPANPTSVRFTARQMRIRVEGVEPNSWRWGIPRVRIRQRGRRG